MNKILSPIWLLLVHRKPVTILLFALVLFQLIILALSQGAVISSEIRIIQLLPPQFKCLVFLLYILFFFRKSVYYL